MKIFLLIILPFFLYASKILSYNIYDRNDRVDIMITFDTPYDGVIKQSSSSGSISIKLENASIESSKVKQLDSKIIKSITITPMQNETQIVAQVPSSTKLQASKTADAYGLRLRLSESSEPKDEALLPKNDTINSEHSLPTKNSDELEGSYYIAITILFIGVAILLFIRKKMPQAKDLKSPWLFEDNQAQQSKQNIEPSKIKISDMANHPEVSIRFQKGVDNQNSVVMLDFMEQSYLVLMGKENILLDKFTDNKPATQNEFDIILQNRHKQLEDFLNNDTLSTMESYKQKASALHYDA